MNIRTALSAVLILNALTIGNLLFAADDPQKQIEALQAGLHHSRAQTAECNLGQIQMAAELDARGREIDRLRKQIEALSKPKDAPPK